MSGRLDQHWARSQSVMVEKKEFTGTDGGEVITLSDPGGSDLHLSSPATPLLTLALGRLNYCQATLSQTL